LVSGTVVDQLSGDDLQSARVTLHRLGPGSPEGAVVWEALSDPDGAFRGERVIMGTYELRVQALGFEPVTLSLTFAEDGVTTVRVEMVPDAVALEPIIVTAVRRSRLEDEGFYERRLMGIGTTLTPEEVDSRAASRVSELFYGVPGVRVLSSRLGGPGDIRLRGGCRPQVVLDGTPLRFPIAIDELLGSVNEVEALEVYHGTSGPFQTLADSCGTVLAWTHQGTDGEGTPFSWRKFFTAVGVATLFLVSGQVGH
jgi:hypothetical protein